MFRNMILKVAGSIVVMAFVVVFFAQPAMAQTASHVYIGDANVVATFGSKAHAMGHDSDANTGQIVEVLDATSVFVSSDYWYQWEGYSQAIIEAWTNELLLNGCVDNIGCGSVRRFTMSANGVQETVVTQPYLMTPSISIVARKGSAYNQIVFDVTVSDVGIWNHSVSFGDGIESVFGFDGPERSFSVPHDYFWKGGTFSVVLKATLIGGGTISKTIQVVVPHP